MALASDSRSGCSITSIPVSSRIASRSVMRFQGGASSICDALPLDLRGAERRLSDVRDELLQPLGRIVVVGVRLVPLDHRELGVVLERDAFVPEVLAELVDALDPADDEPLQVELRRDPQVQVAVEVVVVRNEGPRQRAAVDRLEDGRLDLDEPLAVKPAPRFGDHLGARDEAVANLRVCDQVLLAVAIAEIGVLQARPLVGRRAQALGEQGPFVTRRVSSPLRLLKAVPSMPTMSPRSRPVRAAWPFTEVGRARLELDLAGAINQVEEGDLPHVAVGGDPAGHPVRRFGFLAVLEVLVLRSDARDLDPIRELVRKRLNAGFAQARKLRAALGDDRRLAALRRRVFLSLTRRRAYWWLRPSRSW